MAQMNYLRDSRSEHQEQATAGVYLRPTLYIGLGGFGCAVVRKLKKEVGQLVSEQEAEGFVYLGLDTHRRSLDDILGANEYVPLSLGITPDRVARAEPRFLDWYLKLVGSYKAKSIQEGADKVKVVGRLAFRRQATFQEFCTKLRTAKDRLIRFRDNFATGVAVKVYVVSTLAGGTGAGCLLDVLFVVGKFLREELGPDTPYQAILVTPDVLFGEVPAGHMPEFYSNTYATLKELHHFLTSSDTLVLDYDDAEYSRMTLSSDFLPHQIYVIGDKNESGTEVVTKIEELQDIVASYLLSEIRTPLKDQSGQPKVQDGENTYFGNPGKNDMPRAFSSFGVVRTGFPVDIVKELFARRLVQAALAAELQEAPTIFSSVSDWIRTNSLEEAGADQLQDRIKQEIGGDVLRIGVDAAGTILQPGVDYKRLVLSCRKFVEDMLKAVEDEKKRIIEGKGGDVINQLVIVLQSTFDERMRQRNLGEAMAFLEKLKGLLKKHQAALEQETIDSNDLLTKKLKQEVEISIQGVGSAAKGWLGRSGRVKKAMSDFSARLESMLNKQVDVWIKREGGKVYSRLLEECKKLEDKWTPIVAVLKGHLATAEEGITDYSRLLDKMADIGSRGPGNRFSLVDSRKANQLYTEIVPEESASVTRIRKYWLDNRYLEDKDSTFEKWLGGCMPYIVDNELGRLKSLSFVEILERFYNDDADKRKLFQDLQSLSSPLFWLDPNEMESSYDSYWIIGVHPNLRSDFDSKYEKYLGGQGKVFADFDSLHEVVLYQLKVGYTISSYQGLNSYESHYKLFQDTYIRGKAQRRQVKPVHCWIEAEGWGDLVPRPAEDEAIKWFILGRALNYLFPTPGATSPNDRKNVAFLFSRGNNYYLQVSDSEEPELVGRGLVEAVRSFSERPDWQQVLKQKAESKVQQEGVDEVKKKIEEDYIPNVLEVSIETAEKNSDPRAQLLRKLLSALKKYVQEELQPRV